MLAITRKEKRVFEGMLILLVLGMTVLYYTLGAFQSVALNLFFLPIVLSGYFLGRSSAGILALLCGLSVSAASTLGTTGFAAFSSPVAIGLALSVWAAVLGLTALLMGTLCDDRARTVDELQKAYVGVVDVLSRYLQSANQRVKARSTRIAELCQFVAGEMKLSRKETDDVRVAALLHDLENVEVTTHLINRAVNSLDADSRVSSKYTFLGADLVHSLGTVLDGALPLLVEQNDAVRDCLGCSGSLGSPLGARIISCVRAYDRLVTGDGGAPPVDSRTALSNLRGDPGGVDPAVVGALERVVLSAARQQSVKPADEALVAS